MIAILVGAIINYSTTFPGKGRIKTIGVKIYFDQNCTNEVIELDWGLLNPASLNSRTLYIKNTCNIEITLNLTTKNWNPENASNFIFSSWNYSGQVIFPSEIIETNFYLQVSENITGIIDFSFDYIITALEL